MCPRTILGSCTAIRSLHTRVGIPSGIFLGGVGMDLEIAFGIGFFLADMVGLAPLGIRLHAGQ